jgi:hypothetical protein
VVQAVVDVSFKTNQEERMKVKVRFCMAIGSALTLTACVKTMPPLAQNDEAAPVKVIISQPNHTYAVTGVVFKLEPDANGCLRQKRLKSQSMGGSYKRVFNAQPGDLVAVAVASEYDISTKRACSAAYAFKIDPGFKRYEMGSTGTCATLGFSMPEETGFKGLKNVNTVAFSYPLSPTMEERKADAPCIKAPREIFGG